MHDLLAGSWHLRYSTFPMWHKPAISGVTFNYTPVQERGVAVLKDEVRYLKNGSAKILCGYDIPDNSDDSVYTWRGCGWLRLFSSRWKVEWMSVAKDCIIISFAATWVSPAGIDILTRTASKSEEAIQEALSIVAKQGLLHGISQPLIPVA